MPNPDGSDDTIDVVLLRSVDWIEQTGAEGGKWIDFGLPEMGLYGKALVVAIDACPTIEDGPGRVVLATVTHFNVEVLELKLEGLETPVEPTARHRLFSQDRQAWIPAGELRVGERIRTRTGTARIESIRKKPGIHRVYNLEVETGHSYYVSGLELLSHNDNPCAASLPDGVPPRRGPRLSDVRALKEAGLDAAQRRSIFEGSQGVVDVDELVATSGKDRVFLGTFQSGASRLPGESGFSFHPSLDAGGRLDYLAKSNGGRSFYGTTWDPRAVLRSLKSADEITFVLNQDLVTTRHVTAFELRFILRHPEILRKTTFVRGFYP